MNNSNDSMKDSSESNKKITIEELLNSSDSEKVAIEELLNSSDSERVAIKELIKQSSFVVTSLSNVRIIQPKPRDIEVKPLNYAQVLGLNIPRQTR